ncbi:MAG: DUF1127 domain-containing protein [Pseudomonadota bacterium]
MAYASAPITSRIDILSTLRSRFDDAVEAWGKYRAYRTTLNALSELTDRELLDLDLSRASLREAAYKAAYDA